VGLLQHEKQFSKLNGARNRRGGRFSDSGYWDAEDGISLTVGNGVRLWLPTCRVFHNLADIPKKL
jgi:hypothetical protein